MTASQTSRAAYQNVSFDDWYARILAIMRRDVGVHWCIADMAQELHAEKSTVSARLNEMKNLRIIEEAPKARSRSTGILAYHYKVKIQESLF